MPPLSNLSALLLSFAAPLAAADPACPDPDPAANETLIEAANRLRADHGAPPLRVSTLLARAAAERACEIAASGELPEGGGAGDTGAALTARGYDWSLVAESLAAGTGIDTADVIEGWVADAEPGDPILEPAMREVGLGRASDTGGKIWWAAIYAAPGPAAALASGAEAQCEPPDPEVTAAAVAATNETRAAHGLPPVEASAALSEAAAAHACDMAQHAMLSHEGSDGSDPGERATAAGYDWSLVAENVAFGTRMDLAEAHEGWVASPGHRANILSEGITGMGIGQALAADGITRYWSATYAAPH